MIYGSAVRQYRDDRGLTQAEVVEQIPEAGGVWWLSRRESGDVTVTADEFRRLLEAVDAAAAARLKRRRGA